MLISQYKRKASVEDLCSWTMLFRGTYYYKATYGKRGIKPSSDTTKTDGSIVPNSVVVEDIRDILSGEFVCYGYEIVSKELKKMNYIINKKKVYRLMNEHNLLLGKVIRAKGKRTFVKHRKIAAVKPMEHLCLDIKYIYLNPEAKNYYLLSVIDVYSRKILNWIFQSSIKQVDVIKLLSAIHQQHNITGVYVRNDNGSQFIANRVKDYLLSINALQEFTHIATPEENSYIEAFHSLLQREVVDRFEFNDYPETKLILEAYMQFYNSKRIHRAIGFRTPDSMFEQYYSIIIH